MSFLSSLTNNFGSSATTQPNIPFDPVLKAYAELDKTSSVKHCLDEMASKVDRIITHLISTPIDYNQHMKVDTSIMLFTLIDNGRVNSCLNKKWEVLDVTAKKFLGNVSLLITKLANLDQANLFKIQTEVRSLHNSLPRDDHETMVSITSLDYPLSENSTTRVTILGKFYSSDERPILKVRAGEEVKGKTISMFDFVHFDVPVRLLDKAEPKKIKYQKMFVQVRSQISSSTFWWPFSKEIDALFSIWLRILPNNPGELKVTYERTSESPYIYRKQRSKPFHILPLNIKNEHVLIDCSKGWFFTETPCVTIDYSDVSIFPSCDMLGDKPKFSFSKYSDKYTPPKYPILFHIEYEEGKGSETLLRTETINLQWDQLTKVASSKTEKISAISFKAFTGEEFSLSLKTNVSNPLLKIYEKDGSFIFKPDSTFRSKMFCEKENAHLQDEIIATIFTEYNLRVEERRLKELKDELLKSVIDARGSMTESALEIYLAEVNNQIDQTEMTIFVQQNRNINREQKAWDTLVSNNPNTSTNVSSTTIQESIHGNEEEKKMI